MEKILSLRFCVVLVIATISINLTSCGSDDDNDGGDDSASIVGDWYITGCDFPVYQFKSDGTCTSSYYSDSNGNHSAIYAKGSTRMCDYGTYQINGNSLTIHWHSFQEWDENSSSLGIEDFNEVQLYTISLSGNILKFLSMVDYDELGNIPNDWKPFTLIRK